MATTAFKYSYFRSVCDNASWKKLKSSLPPITCSTSSFARGIHSLYKSHKRTALDKKWLAAPGAFLRASSDDLGALHADVRYFNKELHCAGPTTAPSSQHSPKRGARGEGKSDSHSSWSWNLVWVRKTTAHKQRGSIMFYKDKTLAEMSLSPSSTCWLPRPLPPSMPDWYKFHLLSSQVTEKKYRHLVSIAVGFLFHVRP